MEIKPVITEEQKREFRDPFPTPKGQVLQAHYIFVIPEENKEVVDKLADALAEADMKVKLFAVEGGVSVKAQFRTPMRNTQADSIILPIMQRLDIPKYTVYDGDLTTIDNEGELLSWLSSDLIEMYEEDNEN